MVPRSVGILRLPTSGPLPLDLTLALLAELPVAGDEALPFLEVRIALEEHEPDLRRRIEEVLAGKAVRLVKLSVTAPQMGPALAEQRPSSNLGDLDPREVFQRAYRSHPDEDPPEEMIAAFCELLDGCQTRGPTEAAMPLAPTNPAQPKPTGRTIGAA